MQFEWPEKRSVVPSAEVLKKLGEAGNVLFGRALYRLLRLSGLLLRLLVLGLSGLLGLLILRLAVLRLCRLLILCLLRLLVLGLAILRLSGLLRLLILRLILAGLLAILGLSLLCGTLNRLLRLLTGNGCILRRSLLSGIVGIGYRQTGTAVCGLRIVVAEYALLIVFTLLGIVVTGETGGDYRNFHLVLNVGVDPRAEDYVGGGVYNALYELGRIVYLVEGEVFAAHYV